MKLEACLKAAGALYPDQVQKQLQFIGGWQAAVKGWVVVPSTMNATEFMGYSMGKAFDLKRK